MALPDSEPPQQTSQRLLKGSRDAYRDLFEKSPLPMLVCEPGSLSIVAANDLAAKLHGCTANDLVGTSLFELREVSDLTSVMLKRAAGREVALGFGYHRRPDGTRFPVHVSVHPSELEARPVWLCVLKSLQDALGSSDDEAERRTYEALGRISTGVAHDLNNLLSVILSFTSLVSSQLDEGLTAQGDLREIRGAAERAALLTKQVLSLSRKPSLHPKPTRLNEVVGRLERMLRLLLEDRVTLRVALEPELDLVSADTQQVERLLLAWVASTRENAAPGSTVTIETENVELDTPTGSASHVLLSVKQSTGTVSPERLARLFDLRDSAPESAAGFVKPPMDRVGAKVWAETETDAGTRFVACFPSAGPCVDAARPPTLRPVRPRAAGQTVLVVEDNPHLRKTLRTYFLRDGYRVLDADSSIEALRLAEGAERIDLLLTDFSLPDGSGPELAQALRAHLPDLKVLVASGHEEQRAGVTEDDHTAFIRKPFDLRQFSDLIERLLADLPRVR